MQELDEAIGAAAQMVDLRDTLIIVSADHSHVFNIAGYPLRPLEELPYAVTSYSPGYATSGQAGHGILDVVYDIEPDDRARGRASTDRNGVPYTVLGYHNGPATAARPRVDPRVDRFPGLGGAMPSGPAHPAYLPGGGGAHWGAETHAGEDVAIYAIGAGRRLVRGTVKNTHIFFTMKRALGF